MIWDDKKFYKFCRSSKLENVELLYIKEHIDDILNSFPDSDKRFIKVFTLYNSDRNITYKKLAVQFDVAYTRIHQIVKKMERRIVKKALNNLYNRAIQMPDMKDIELCLLDNPEISSRTLNVLARHNVYTVLSMIRYLNIHDVKTFAELKAKNPYRYLINAGEKSIKEMDDLVSKILKMSEEPK